MVITSDGVEIEGAYNDDMTSIDLAQLRISREGEWLVFYDYADTKIKFDPKTLEHLWLAARVINWEEDE